MATGSTPAPATQERAAPPADAAEPIAKVLERARALQRTTGGVLDTLLRMERDLRASARVKAGYAYRVDKV